MIFSFLFFGQEKVDVLESSEARATSFQVSCGHIPCTTNCHLMISNKYPFKN